MPDIFDEVNEDLRAEKASRLLRKYGGAGAAVLVLILAGTGAYVWWQEQQGKQAEAVATKFIAAQKAAEVRPPAKPAPAALQDFASLAATAPEGYRVLARLQLAALEWNQGKTAQAITDWADVANDAAAPQTLRDLATLSSVQHQTDTGDAKALKTQLEPLLLGNSPWKALAQQNMAMLDLRLGRIAEARALVKNLTTDFSAPEGVRQMAADLLLTLGDDQAAPAGAKPAGSKG